MPPITAASAHATGLDDEFLFQLSSGSELLSRGDPDGARASLERALAVRPRDVHVLGLLGQAYYRLGRFEDAAGVWQRLVDESPVEPAARVNLGLANLKARRYPEAVKQLEIALDLNPEHRKAMGYLGLAYLESGAVEAARGWFERAGSEQMVARCDALLAAPPAAADAPAEAASGAAESASSPVEAATGPVEAQPAPAEEPAPDEPEVRIVEPGAVEPRAVAAPQPWASARQVHAGGDAPFALDGDVLVVNVRGEIRARLDGLFAIRGRVALAGERKRFRGRPTDPYFGEGPLRMHRAAGEGALLFRAAGRRFAVRDLGAEGAYFREDVVFGFEHSVAFENGRVPSSTAELNLVHLRGPGALLLSTAGDPVSLDVTRDAPLTIPLAALVGWFGALTPRILPLVQDGADGPLAAVELAGEGRVLVDPAALAEAHP